MIWSDFSECELRYNLYFIKRACTRIYLWLDIIGSYLMMNIEQKALYTDMQSIVLAPVLYSGFQEIIFKCSKKNTQS